MFKIRRYYSLRAPYTEAGAKFSMMSDHPVILQQNMFYTLRHLLHFGLSKSNAISKITSEAAQGIGQKDQDLKHHLLFGTEILFH